jgi:hypothetical protein
VSEFNRLAGIDEFAGGGLNPPPVIEPPSFPTEDAAARWWQLANSALRGGRSGQDAIEIANLVWHAYERRYRALKSDLEVERMKETRR